MRQVYGMKVVAQYPGRSAVSVKNDGLRHEATQLKRQKSAEGIVTLPNWSEGPNLMNRNRRPNFR